MFAPLWDQSGIDMEFQFYLSQIETSHSLTQINPMCRISYVHMGVPCIINGIGVRSVDKYLSSSISAGTSDDRCNDWASIIASL